MGNFFTGSKTQPGLRRYSHDCAPALAWCRQQGGRLKRGGSKLEFELLVQVGPRAEGTAGGLGHASLTGQQRGQRGRRGAQRRQGGCQQAGHTREACHPVHHQGGNKR